MKPEPQSTSAADTARGRLSLPDASLCVAPMMAWTTRHCRFLHRLLAPNALLFTEMVTTGALLHGAHQSGLAHLAAEQPLALQLGGSNPDDLAECVRLASQAGFAEINLNLGCPSDRVRNGQFGACLMRNAQLVAECIQAMKASANTPITVKCRLGVDELESDEFIADFLGQVLDAGSDRIYLHARKAILGGLSPAQNRSLPPLKYQQAYRLARHFQSTANQAPFVMNGGIQTPEQANQHREAGFGVMIGRAAWHNPLLLASLDAAWFEHERPALSTIMKDYLAYVHDQVMQGTSLGELTRPLLGIVNGRPGARRFRQILSDSRRLKRGDISMLDEALAIVLPVAA